ncbi:triacylglycerol lipase [Flavobacterium sp. JAS]|uniref:esterase/lipase family protein n=1 Tax=Flavobacterium sp. JAS TaxID=2897329 RepID=UPI001E3380AD|nr:hypothetical protein [Flavobacterium sp. JAS]MCD0470360.1 hypothetical protein [Flavobacterium sp. JAS]
MKPIIFIPGIEATALVNANTFDFDVKWNAYDTIFTSLGTKISGPYIEEKLQQNPLYDQNINTIVERNHIARLPYDKTIYNIAAKFSGDPVYLFGYDWRLSNAVNGKRLAQYVEYLKNKLQDHSVEGFRFITHSMGALVFNCYLSELNGNYDDINKVVLCAPPFRGSPYAVIHAIKGDGGLKSFLSKIFGRNEDIRKVVRTYPSLLELAPWYENSMTFDDNTPVDLTKLDHWQSNIWDDIQPLFEARLTALTDFRNRQLFDLSKLPDTLRSRMIIVVGSKDKTITGLKVLKKKENIKSFVQLDKLVTGSGDGTVPFDSSTIYKDSIRTIEVKKENLFLEFGNNIDFHGLFLCDSRVQNIINRMFDDNIQTAFTRDKKINELFGNKNKDWWESIGDSVKSVSTF